MRPMQFTGNERGEFRLRRTVGLTIVALFLLVTPVAVARQLSSHAALDVPDLTVTTLATGSTDAAGQPVVIVEQGGSGGEPTSPEDALTPARNHGEGPRRIKYLVGDGWVPIDNGGAVPLDNGMEVVVTLTPYPPIDFAAQADFFLTSGGVPVTDAEISLVYDMFIMGHGPFTTVAESAGGGHYRSDFDFFMFGPWELIQTVQLPDVPSTEFTLSLYIWPV